MDIKKTNPKVSIAKEFAEGTTFVVTPEVEVADEQVVVRCTEGALKGMLWHALRGLPESEEGGSVDGTEAVEVKGFLLGQVKLTNEQRIVTIKEIVQLPINEKDAGDMAVFNAKDRAILEGKLRARPSLQLVGNYHSHPNHEIKLSDQDVVYLSQYLPESYHVAAIVGPREPAVGFFLKNAEGEYAPWQDPVSRTDYVKVEMKKKNKDDPSAKTGFAWRPAIEVVVDGSGRVTHVSGKRINKKRIAIFAAAAVVLLAVIIILAIPDTRALMKVSPTELSFSSSSEEKQIVLLELDNKGEFQFIIEDEDPPPWLEIDKLKGELNYEQPRELMVMVNIGQIPLRETRKHTFNIIGSPVKGGPGNTVQLTVHAENDKTVVPIEQEWDLPPLRVVDGRFFITLPGEPAGSDIQITVRGSSMRDGRWHNEWTETPTGRSFYKRNDAFGSPLSWNRIKVVAKAVLRITNPDQILRYEYTGSRTLDKKTMPWDLDPPENIEGKITLSTKPIDFPGEARFTAHRGREVESADIKQHARQAVSYVFEYSDKLSKVGVDLVYVGDNGVYELSYEHVLGKDAIEDVNFDNSQGPEGKSFRRAYPEKYSAANLALFGQYGGPRRLMDIPPEERWGRLTILGGNNMVHESWKDIIAIGDEAQGGRMAWEYNHRKSAVVLYFVFEENEHRELLAWLLQQDKVYEELEPGIKSLGGRIHYYWGPSYANKKVYDVNR